MLKQFNIKDGKVIENGMGNAAVLFYINPDETERRYLVDELKIDEYNVNSALDPNELGRIEFEDGHTVFIIKRPKRYSSEDNFLLKIASIGIFLFPDKIVMLLTDDVPLFTRRQFHKVRSIPDLLLKILHSVIIHFDEHLQVIHSISDELEREINKSMANSHLLNMFNLEKSLVYYLKAIGANGKVIEKLKTHAAKFNFSPDEIELLDDVSIENGQCNEQANTYSQVLSNMMDAWVSIVSNNLNIFIKMLTLIMICIMLPTLVFSMFSMNMKYPFNTESPIVFWAVSAVALLSMAGVIIIWRKKKW